jgi:hypothetical protein
MPIASVDYVAYETKLEHNDPQRGVINRVYVQVHNRGIQTASNVTVKILYANASPGLPSLPADFWTAFPGNGDQTNWKAIGAAKVIPSLSPRRPEILEWDWVPPLTASQHSCLLIVVDSPGDPIPAAHKVFDIGTLVTQEKRVGLKNLHVIDALPAPFWSGLTIFGATSATTSLRLEGIPRGWSVGLLFPSTVATKLEFTGLKQTVIPKAHVESLTKFLGRTPKAAELKPFVAVTEPAQKVAVSRVPSLKNGVELLLSWKAGDNAESGVVNVIQMDGQNVIGGNTFVLRRAR